MRLIDADPLIEAAQIPEAYGYVDIYQITDAPTIEAEPVKHGHWIETDFYDFYHTEIYECSHCHNETASHVIKLYNRCPKCGAKMDGDVSK